MTTTVKPISRKPSEEEMIARRTQIYMQKRETFALNALNKLLEKKTVKNDKDIESVVVKAVTIADKLLVTLYSDENSEASTDKEDK